MASVVVNRSRGRRTASTTTTISTSASAAEEQLDSNKRQRLGLGQCVISSGRDCLQLEILRGSSERTEKIKQRERRVKKAGAFKSAPSSSRAQETPVQLYARGASQEKQRKGGKHVVPVQVSFEHLTLELNLISSAPAPGSKFIQFRERARENIIQTAAHRHRGHTTNAPFLYVHLNHHHLDDKQQIFKVSSEGQSLIRAAGICFGTLLTAVESDECVLACLPS